MSVNRLVGGYFFTVRAYSLCKMTFQNPFSACVGRRVLIRRTAQVHREKEKEFCRNWKNWQCQIRQFQHFLRFYPPTLKKCVFDKLWLVNLKYVSSLSSIPTSENEMKFSKLIVQRVEDKSDMFHSVEKPQKHGSFSKKKKFSLKNVKKFYTFFADF